MSGADLPGLIDQLGTASLEARQLLGDIRTATKDLRAAAREAAAERERLAATIKDTVEADIKVEVKRQLKDLGEETRKAMYDATAKVGREFERLTNIMMTGDDYGRVTDGFDLRKVAERQKRRQALGGAL